MMPLVAVVILNTNRRCDTLECLGSLARSSYDNMTVFVLDNSSTDGSVAAIRASHPDVRLVQLNENKGYAGNNNTGLEQAVRRGADWVFVLNEDTMVARDCIADLVAVGESRSRVGILGPMVYHASIPSMIQSAGGRLDRWWCAVHAGQNEVDTGQFSLVRPVDWVSGCALLIRREAINEVGMFDERFFYYWEETDLCFRVRKHGWRVMHVPYARLWHKGVDPDYAPSPSVTYYDTRNRLLFLSKHEAPLHVRCAAWMSILRTLLAWSLRPNWRHMRRHRMAMTKALMDYSRRRWGQRVLAL